MPIQSNIIAVNPDTTINAGKAQLSIDQKNSTSKANFPWTVRISQAVHGQTFTNGSFIQVGFDTLTHLSYRSFSTPTYALNFSSITSGGHSFPYSQVSVPQYGLYDVKFCVSVNTPDNPASMGLWLVVNVNGSNASIFSSNQVGTPDSGYLSVLTTDTYELNPNDQLTFFINQANSNGSNEPCANTNSLTYVVIHYQGQS